MKTALALVLVALLVGPAVHAQEPTPPTPDTAAAAAADTSTTSVSPAPVPTAADAVAPVPQKASWPLRALSKVGHVFQNVLYVAATLAAFLLVCQSGICR